MIKTIIKETIIIILLLVAIILGLGVLLYDYIPNNKVVPTILEYKTPDNISEELQESVTQESKEVIITYEVDAKDLNVYEKTNQYDAGNPHPFSYYSTGSTSGNTTGNNTNTTENTNTTGVGTKDEGTFFESTGTK